MFLNWFLEQERKGEWVGVGRRKGERFVIPCVYVFIGCFLYVSCSEIEPAALVYWDIHL